MATLKLYGDLKQYGSKFKIDASTAQEVLSCLYVQIKGFKSAIMNGFFRIRVAKQDLSNETVYYGLHTRLKPEDVIHIIPVVEGAGGGSGIFQVVVGAVITGVGIFTGNAALIGFGVGMMIGGIASMLTKQTTADTTNHTNTSFSNFDNTIGQGQPVPLCYGLMLIGSSVISQGVETY